MAGTTKQAAFQMPALAMQMPDVVQGILGGQSAFQILVQQGRQVVQVVGGMGAALRTRVAYMGGPYVLSAGVAAAGLGTLAARSADLTNEQRQLDVALRGVGRAAEVSASSLATYIRALEKQGVARDAARAIGADLARTQGLSSINAGRVAALAPDLAAAVGSANRRSFGHDHDHLQPGPHHTAHRRVLTDTEGPRHHSQAAAAGQCRVHHHAAAPDQNRRTHHRDRRQSAGRLRRRPSQGGTGRQSGTLSSARRPVMQGGMCPRTRRITPTFPPNRYDSKTR